MIFLRIESFKAFESLSAYKAVCRVLVFPVVIS